MKRLCRSILVLAHHAAQVHAGLPAGLVQRQARAAEEVHRHALKHLRGARRRRRIEAGPQAPMANGEAAN